MTIVWVLLFFLWTGLGLFSLFIINEIFLAIVFGVILLIHIFGGIRIIFQYERGVLFTLGKYAGLLEPGIRFIVPVIQTIRKIDMRIITADIPKQEVMTKDNIPIFANAVVYYKVDKPEDAVLKIEDYSFAVRQYTLATMRDIIGNYELDIILTQRDKISADIKILVDKETRGWGVDITSIKLQELELPAEMKRAIAKQAEAEREKRARILVSEGEWKASENMRKAAETLSRAKGSMTLRTLATIKEIAADPSEKIVIVVPTEFESITSLFRKNK